MILIHQTLFHQVRLKQSSIFLRLVRITNSLNNDTTLGRTNPKDNSNFKRGVVYGLVFSGVNIQTVVLNMEKVWNMKTASDFNNATPGYVYRGNVGDSTTGIRLNYGVEWDTATKVKGLGCFVYSEGVGNGVPMSELVSVAGNFFGYCATVPYTNSNPQKAKQWVLDNIEKMVSTDNVVETTIGNVMFTMSPIKIEKTQPNL